MTSSRHSPEPTPPDASEAPPSEDEATSRTSSVLTSEAPPSSPSPRWGTRSVVEFVPARTPGATSSPSELGSEETWDLWQGEPGAPPQWEEGDWDDEDWEEDEDEDDAFLRELVQGMVPSESRLPIAPPRLPQANDVLGDAFEIIRSIGHGGMGQVFLARDLKLGRHVAVKVMLLNRQSRRQRDDLLTLFEREAVATAQLNHPNAITIYHHGAWEGQPYVVLEFLDGEPLNTHLQNAGGPLPVQQALDIVLQVLRGLAHAHGQGVIHRDLKPGNVFVQRDGLVKVLDFGLAALNVNTVIKEAGREGAVALGERLEPRLLHAGTPAYKAPEQWRGEPQDDRADLWAVGIILFEMLAGQRPFASSKGSSPRVPPSLAQWVPEPSARALDPIVRRALAWEPGDRYATAQELLGALTQVRQTLTVNPTFTEEPYQYLEAFTEEDAPWFFGRQRESARLRGMIRTRAAVAVVGPSGAGKSSLVQAGLIPRLREDTSPWRVLRLVPGRAPMENLLERLQSLYDASSEGSLSSLSQLSALDSEDRALRDALTDPDALLASPGLTGQLLRLYARARDVQLLLFVDQFEELYIQVSDSAVRQAFMAALFSAADDPASPVRLILTMREDFRSRLAESGDLHRALATNTLYLGVPDTDAKRAALVEPARRLGYAFEEGLAEAMIRDLEDDSAPLPLLQFAASRLWERRDAERKKLTHQALKALGGVSGVMATHADEVLHQFTNNSDLLCAQLVVCNLVTPEGTKRRMRRAQLIERFEDQQRAARVLDHLIQGRLLTSIKVESGVWVELAHESLIERWERLRLWLSEDKESLRFHEHLNQATTHWVEQGRPRGLLWDGEMLEEALQWRRQHETMLSPAEKTFLEAAAERAHTGRRLRRAVAVGVLAMSLIVAVVSLIIMNQYRELSDAATANALKASRAEQEARALLKRQQQAERVAASREIAAYAREALDVYPMRSLLLAREAARIRPTTQALNALHQALLGTDERTFLLGHERPVRAAAFSPDGTRIVTASDDKTARVWGLDGAELATLSGHEAAIYSVAFSPDGQRIVTASGDRTARLWSLDGVVVATLSGHEAAVYRVAFSPDGQVIATSSGDHTARLWSREGEPLATLTGHQDSIWSVTFSPDGQRLLTGSADGTARLWDMAGDELRVLKGHAHPVETADFSPDGQRVVTASIDRTARLWDLNGNQLRVFEGHSQPLYSATFSPDGRYVLTASEDRTARIWSLDPDPDPDAPASRILRGHEEPIVAVAFSPDGRYVLTASRDATARLWNIDGDPLKVLKGHQGPIWVVAFSPDGRYLLTGSQDRTVRLWSPDRVEVALLKDHKDALRNGRFSPDGKHIITASRDNTARLWDFEGRQRAVFRGHQDALRDAAFSPDGQRVVTASIDHTARIWAPDGAQLKVLRGHQHSVWNVTFSPDGQHILTASRDTTARLWSVSGEALTTFKGHLDSVWVARFSPDGQRVVTASSDNTARLWKIDGSLIAELQHDPSGDGRGHDVKDATFSPNGQYVVTVSSDSKVRIWDAAGHLLHTLAGHTGTIRAVRFRPDGDLFATASDDTTARLWSIDGRLQAVLRGHQDALRHVTFSPDGRHLLTSATDHTARMWDTHTRTATVLGGHQGTVLVARFSPDSRHVLTASIDGTARLYLTRYEDLAALAAQRSTRELTPEERTQYGLDRPNGLTDPPPPSAPGSEESPTAPSDPPPSSP